MRFSPCDLAEARTVTATTVEWEEPDCPLCGGKERTPVVEACDQTEGGTGLWFAVVQCQACGLCYTNPRPSPHTILKYYPPQYEPHRAIPRQTRRISSALKKLRPEQREVGRLTRGRLMDFGCGTGGFMAVMQRLGWDVLGMDICPQAIQRLKLNLGLPAIQGTLPNSDLEPASFHVITMWQALEHVHEPLDVLAAARRLLVPGGKLFVALPNIDSLAFRWFGACWHGLDLPRHLTHFAPWTLSTMLQKAGFRVGRVRMVRQSNWLRRSAEHASRADLGTWWRRLMTGKQLSRLVTSYGAATSQADCMVVVAER